MRFRIIFFAISFLFLIQTGTLAGITYQDNQLFPDCFLDQVLSLERSADSSTFSHLLLHPLDLLKHKEQRLIYQGGFEDLYHENRGGEKYREIWFNHNRINAIIPLKNKLEGSFAFSLAEEEFKLRLPSEPKYDLDFKGEKNFAQFIFAQSLFSSLLQIGAGTKTLEISGTRFWDYSLEFAFSPFNRLKFGLTHRKLNLNYFLDLQYEDSFIDLPVNLVIEQNDFHFSFDLLSDLKFTSDYQETKLKRNQKLSHQTNYFLDPYGDLFSFSTGLTLKLSSELQLYFGQRKNYIKSTGDLYYQDQKFGKITRLKLIEEGGFSKLSLDKKGKPFFSSEVEFIKISGEGRGHIETWPFTPTLIDLLGQRLYFRLNGEAKVFRLGFEYHGSFFSFLSSKSDLDYLSIQPSGEAATWNPVFLVFGIRNLKEYLLSYERINSLFLRITFSRKFKNLSFGYNFSQFIPIHIKKREINKGKSNGNTPVDLLKKSTGGGRAHMISLSYGF